MHEVAEPGARALPHLVLAAAGLAEVGHGRQLGVHGPTAEPAVVEVVDCLLGILFATELAMKEMLCYNKCVITIESYWVSTEYLVQISYHTYIF